jgi:hypothetical protein
MWGTRGPYPPAAAMVGYGCVVGVGSWRLMSDQPTVGIVKIVYGSIFFMGKTGEYHGLVIFTWKMPHLYLFLCEEKAKALRFGICHSLPFFIPKYIPYRLVWATKVALAAICLVFPALVLGYYFFIIKSMTYQFLYRLKNLYDYCWQR